MSGKVFLIGCGVREGHIAQDGLKALKASDVALYDRLVDKEVLSSFKGRKVYVGKNQGESSKQEKINSLLYKLAGRGKTVARLKGGDSFFFSRGPEEYEYLKERGVDVSVIPGVSAFQALSDYGIPLTRRGVSSSVSFITGARAEGGRAYGGLTADTLVFYMPVGSLRKIVAQVRKRKRKAHCMLVENAGKDNYRILEGGVDEIVDVAEEAEVSPPALLVVSPYRRRIYGRRVLAFRQKSREMETLRQLSGFEVTNYPLYDVRYRRIRKTASKIAAFTSPNAVESVFSQHRLSGKFVAIGERTAEALRKYGVKASVPKMQSSRGLMKCLSRYHKKDVVVYCSPHTRVRGFRRVYAYDVEYKTKAPGLKGLVKEAEILLITSSEILSTLCGLVAVKLLNEKTVVVLGPKTAAEAKKHGLHVDHTLEKPSLLELRNLR